MRLLALVSTFGAAMAAAVSSQPSTTEAPVPASSANSSSPAMFQLSSDQEFAFVLETFLSLANTGGAATGEVLRAASQIVPGDIESWYREFKYLADQMRQQATNMDAKRFPVAVRQAMFRASAYYRAADFFLHGNPADPRINSLWAAQTAAFDAALALLPIPGVRHTLPADGFQVPIIFYAASSERKQRPTVVVGSGYDAAQEDSYHAMCREILERGWNCVTYEGPGQPTVRRQQNIGFIPEWWKAVSPVVDWLHTQSDVVDTARLALMGVSFGGQLAPLAASREHRFAATMAIDGVADLASHLLAGFSPKVANLFHSGNRTAFDQFLLAAEHNASTPTSVRWGLEQGLWSFDTSSPYDWITTLQKFAITPAVARMIRGPIFIGSGQDDSIMAGQPELLTQRIGSSATYHRFDTALGAGEHCQIGAESQLAAVALGWLDGIFTGHNATVGGY